MLGNDDFARDAAAVLRWGLLSYAVGLFVSQLLLKTPATLDSSAWYFANMLTALAAAVALASWGLYTGAGHRRPARSPA
jgi:hypothetical protein